MIKKIFATLLAGLCFMACDPVFGLRDGDWTPMEWSHLKYETVKVDGRSYFFVPVEGGSYGFRCKNYKPWLSDHVFEVNGEVLHSYLEYKEPDWHHYENEWCRVEVVNDSVKVDFQPNDGGVRKARIGVTAGDIFDDFKFIQQSGIYTE